MPKTSKDANIIKRQVHDQKQITRYRSNDIFRYEFIKSRLIRDVIHDRSLKKRGSWFV
ncbi:hypothetical protein QTP88_021689 [Uroleucon formosanum]